jgi:hypothetical protein
VRHTERVSQTSVTRRRRKSRPRRVFLVGFLVGFVVTLPAALLALVATWAEAALPWVVPGLLLTRPLAREMQDWPGAVNIGLAAVANGLVYGLVVLIVVTVLQRLRRPAARP